MQRAPVIRELFMKIKELCVSKAITRVGCYSIASDVTRRLEYGSDNHHKLWYFPILQTIVNTQDMYFVLYIP